MMRNTKVRHEKLALLDLFVNMDVIDIWDDIAEECSKFGTIVDMKIPRPSKSGPVPGCGLVGIFFRHGSWFRSDLLMFFCRSL